MARYLYSALLYLLLPLIGLRLLWRARKQPEYLQKLGERFGFYERAGGLPVIWVHAVSVGETRAAAPLISALQTAWPGYQILLTCMTPTGRAAGREVYGDSVIQAYLPYDYPGAVARFLRHFRPQFGLLMETEIWPNLLAASAQRKVPLFLVNARLSERSARGYQRFSALSGPAFRALQGIAAQTAADAGRLSLLGADPVSVAGNLKFDVEPDAAKLALGDGWRTALAGRAICLAASTREGEEAALLAAWRTLARPDILLVIVPRHPQRFAEVASLVEGAGFSLERRSQSLPTAATAVWLGDSMGEMPAYYRMADVALIGGSLAPLGGQNLIEAAACACPVLIGPHTFNFKQATEDAIAEGAARRIVDAQDWANAVDELLGDPVALAGMREAALRFSGVHRGATRRTLDFIRQQLGRVTD